MQIKRWIIWGSVMMYLYSIGPMSNLHAKPGEEYLKKVVVNTAARRFNLHSNRGETKEINCVSLTEFMQVLSALRETDGEFEVVYSGPKVQGEI